MSALPVPSFIERDPEALVRDMVAWYESQTQKTLQPAQLERLLINNIAYRESLVRAAIQDAAMLNLVHFSRAPMLDYLAANMGLTRLPAVAAQTTLRFTFSPAPATDTLLPAGVQVEGGGVSFTTLADVTVPAGALSIDVPAQCTEAGAVGNGFVAGQISDVSSVDIQFIETAQNIAITGGGTEAEDDERLKQRIMLAPEQFSTAGSAGAYKFHALSAHPDVVDVAVFSPAPGQVHVSPLVKTGLPSQAVKDAVLAACSAETVRPLTDTVSVVSPTQVFYSLSASLTLLIGADTTLAQAQAQAAAQAYVNSLAARLGADIVRSQLIKTLHGYGVYSVSLTEPAVDQTLSAADWPSCTGVSITITGVAAG